MTFQAYLDTIERKTGLSIDELRARAAEKGFEGVDVKATPVIEWLAADYGLGRVHAMTMVHMIKEAAGPLPTDEERIDALFSGPREHWRAAYDSLLAYVRELGGDVEVVPAKTYIGLTRGGRKFAIVAATGQRLNLGLKLRGREPESRLIAAGAWNAMVTHRVAVDDAAQIDAEVLGWLRESYEAG
jgi:predicted transport protein